ncbi:MAG: UPF0149 family protein [Aestuariivirga sp.]|uniref:UPF0149 family protein n=1 Tax=Aestuariivirga sp. TaxID=2650926 RepID=UPI0038CF980B
MSEDTICQLESFKAYATSGRAPRWTMAPDDLHGFLTGLAMAGPLPCANWTDWIWSGETPRFLSEDEEWKVMNDLLSFEEEVRCAVAEHPRLDAAILPKTEDGLFLAADWAEGFMQAIEANPGPWQSAIHQVESSLAVVLCACYHNHDAYFSGLVSPEQIDNINQHLDYLASVIQAEARGGLQAA